MWTENNPALHKLQLHLCVCVYIHMHEKVFNSVSVIQLLQAIYIKY